MKSRHILSENAYEAWTEAVYYCKKIESGFITLQYRKQFVATLHNSVELLIKQHMLNVNDYRVVVFRKVKDNGEPAKSFYSSMDLNSFFINNKEGMEKAYSVEFNKLVEYQKTLFETYYDKNKGSLEIVNKGMELLKDLRNMETHFYINGSKFLTDQEFIQLYNFMLKFYEIQKEYHLLPFFGKPFGKSKNIAFEDNLPKNFTYKSAVKKSEYYDRIKARLNNQLCLSGDDSFAIINDLLESYNDKPDDYINYGNYNMILSYIESMLQMGLLTLKQETEEYENEGERGYTVFDYYVFV